MRIGGTGRIFKGRPRSTPGKNCSFVQANGPLNHPKPALFQAIGRRTAVNALVVNGGRVVQAAGNSSSVTGGAWARRVESGSARNPRCSRIFFATSGSSMQAMSRILP